MSKETYIVNKRCFANEFVSVKANSKADAIAKAKENEGNTLFGHLEYNGYLPSNMWSVEKMKETNEHYRENPSKN